MNRFGSNNSNWKGGLVERTCQYCGKTFMKKPCRIKIGAGKYCSKQCKCLARRGVSINSKRIIKYCLVCGKEIKIKVSHANEEGSYCSKECMSIGYKSTLKGKSNPNWKGGDITFICKNCNKTVTVNRTPKIRIFCSISCAASWRIKNMGSIIGNNNRSRSGKREDLNNLFVRSSWEANYARYLNWLVGLGEIKKWEYEVDEFKFEKIKKGNRFYIPDFKITNNDNSIEYHEVKGYMDADSKTKLSRMARYYPEIKLILIDKPVYSVMAKQLKNLIPNWEIA